MYLLIKTTAIATLVISSLIGTATFAEDNTTEKDGSTTKQYEPQKPYFSPNKWLEILKQQPVIIIKHRRRKILAPCSIVISKNSNNLPGGYLIRDSQEVGLYAEQIQQSNNLLHPGLCVRKNIYSPTIFRVPSSRFMPHNKSGFQQNRKGLLNK